MTLTHQLTRPTPVHYPPALTHTHSFDTTLGNIISATHQTSVDINPAHDPPLFSTEHLQQLDYEAKQGFPEVEVTKDHHHQAYDIFVAYCKLIGGVCPETRKPLAPSPIVDEENGDDFIDWFYKYALVPRFENENGWIGNTFVPNSKKIDRLGVSEHILQGAEIEQTELKEGEELVTKTLERESTVCNAPAHWFPTMVVKPVSSKHYVTGRYNKTKPLSEQVRKVHGRVPNELGIWATEQNGGLGPEKKPSRVRVVIEPRREAEPRPVGDAQYTQFSGDLATVVAHRNKSAQNVEPACWTRKADTPITFDKHVERVAYRPGLPEQFEQVTEKSRRGVDGKPDKHSWSFLYNQPLDIADHSSEVWCETCVDYVPQVEDGLQVEGVDYVSHQCVKTAHPITTEFYQKMVHFPPPHLYRASKSGRYAECVTAKQVEKLAEREQERINRVTEYLCNLADGLVDGVNRVAFWLSNDEEDRPTREMYPAFDFPQATAVVRHHNACWVESWRTVVFRKRD